MNVDEDLFRVFTQELGHSSRFIRSYSYGGSWYISCMLVLTTVLTHFFWM